MTSMVLLVIWETKKWERMEKLIKLLLRFVAYDWGLQLY